MYDVPSSPLAELVSLDNLSVPLLRIALRLASALADAADIMGCFDYVTVGEWTVYAVPK
jgi:hypothetical protein